MTQKVLTELLAAKAGIYEPESHMYMIGNTILGENTTNPVPWIKVDNSTFYLMPNNLNNTRCKILDIALDWSSTQWKLKYSACIDGVIYTKYINFDA